MCCTSPRRLGGLHVFENETGSRSGRQRYDMSTKQVMRPQIHEVPHVLRMGLRMVLLMQAMTGSCCAINKVIAPWRSHICENTHVSSCIQYFPNFETQFRYKLKSQERHHPFALSTGTTPKMKQK